MVIKPRQQTPQSEEYMTHVEHFQFDAIAPMPKVDEQVALIIHLTTSLSVTHCVCMALHAIVGTDDDFCLNKASSTWWPKKSHIKKHYYL